LTGPKILTLRYWVNLAQPKACKQAVDDGENYHHFAYGALYFEIGEVIKYAEPVAGTAAGIYAGPIGAVMGAEYAKDLAGQIKLMEELAPDRKASDHTSRVSS
jgi:hypothetical protein